MMRDRLLSPQRYTSAKQKPNSLFITSCTELTFLMKMWADLSAEIASGLSGISNFILEEYFLNLETDVNRHI